MNLFKPIVSAARNFFGGRLQSGLPTERQHWLGPRFEPINISAAATIQDVQTAIRQAESGETTSLFRFYRDALLGDDHIQGELNKRKLAVIGQPLAVLPVDKDSEDDVRAAAACDRAIRDCDNWNAGLSNLLSSSQWPVSIAENIFRPADPFPVTYAPNAARNPERVSRFNLQYTLKRLEPVNPMLFCFRHAYLVGGIGMGTASPIQQVSLNPQPSTINPATGPNADWYAINLNDWEPFLRLWPIDDQGRIIYDASQASRLDPDRHLVHRGHLLTDQRDNWGGPMRAILFWWLLRGLGRDWFARFMERYGSPFPVGKTNVQDKESVALLEQAFSLATKIGGLVIGQDDAVELKEAVVQGGAEGHALWHRTCNNAISKHVTGYGADQKPAGLNAGESDVQENVRADIRIFDGKTLSETLEKQLFARLLRFNGLAGRIRVQIGALSPDDAEQFATTLKTAAEAGWEPTDAAAAIIDEKFGMPMQRSQISATKLGLQKQSLDEQAQWLTDKYGQTSPTSPTSQTDDEVETLSARDQSGRLLWFSAGSDAPRSTLHAPKDPLAPILSSHTDLLAAAYRGSMAPFRQIIESSTSRQDCERRLAAAYADWSPARLSHELDQALQLCSATGAANQQRPKTQILSAKDPGGSWITINGTHVFVKSSQSPEQALKEKLGGSSAKENTGKMKSHGADKDEALLKEHGLPEHSAAQKNAYQKGKADAQSSKVESLNEFEAKARAGDLDYPDFAGSEDPTLTRFWEAGLLGHDIPRPVLAERIGDPPKENRSMNFQDQRFEKGVSVLRVVGDTRKDAGTFDLFNDGKHVLISGFLVPHHKGGDNEPLLVGTRKVRDL